jgi:hypothetical protein
MIRQCRNSPKIQWENFRKKQVKIDTPYTQIYYLSSSWLTQLRTILILWDQISCYDEPFWTFQNKICIRIELLVKERFHYSFT